MKNSFGLNCYLAALSTLGYLAMDMYLPAFSTLSLELGLSNGEVGASLSIFLLGFAVGQLIWGPLSDRLGRRPIILTGLVLFIFGCIAMYWATNIVCILILRFVQAISVCAAAVTWQAIVIDRYSRREADRVLANILPIMGLSPALAPLLGAYVLSSYGWRFIFLILALITLFLIIITLFFKESNRKITKGRPINYKMVLSSPIFFGNALIFSASSASFVAWLTASPFILGNMGYGPGDIGLSYFLPTLGFLSGGYSCRCILDKVKGSFLLPKLISAYCICMLSLYLLGLQTSPSIFTLMIPFFFIAVLPPIA